jgi:CspA family cold shock protein
MKGKIKMFNPEKGYGFISFGNPTNEDVFFHASEVFGEALFKKGDICEFNIVDGQKGRCAINVIRGIRNV